MGNCYTCRLQWHTSIRISIQQVHRKTKNCTKLTYFSNKIWIKQPFTRKSSWGTGTVPTYGWGKGGRGGRSESFKSSRSQHYKVESTALYKCRHKHIVSLLGAVDGKTCGLGTFADENDPKNHPSLVFEDKENHDKKAYVLMLEYCALGDLYEVVEHQKVISSERMARALIKPVFEGLQHAFEQGFSHRDIKLENIFIDSTGIVKVGDWGLATHHRYSRSSVGTLGYMAPEMLCRSGYCANKVDVWACGVMLFSMCTNTRPYGEPSHRKKNAKDNSWKDDWLSAILQEKWKLWWLSHMRTTPEVCKLSHSLCHLLQCMLQPDPSKRWSTQQVLGHPWMTDPDMATPEEIVALCANNAKVKK